jgi:hypothetical protein
VKKDDLHFYAGDCLRVARLACVDMATSCQKAARNFPHNWMDRAQAFVKAAEDLARVCDRLQPIEADMAADQGMQLVVLTVPMLQPPRLNRVLPKWARAANMGAALRSLAAAWPKHQEVLVQCAYELEAITFPTLAGYDFPKQSPLKPVAPRDNGPRIIPARAT